MEIIFLIQMKSSGDKGGICDKIRKIQKEKNIRKKPMIDDNQWSFTIC